MESSSLSGTSAWIIRVVNLRNFRIKKLYTPGFRKENFEKQEDWRTGGGTPYWIMVILSRSLDISKNELARYFTSCLDSTFRLWLAEVRLCSFSARTYLYRIFKLKEGCTPTEWREKMAENVASEGKKQD